MSVKYVYSGNYRQGDCGAPTNMVDCTDKPLFVGDIVVIATVDKFGISCFYGMSVIVSNKYTSYSDGSHVVNPEPHQCFVMGIIDVDFMKEDSGWMVSKVKSYEDAIDGEHWKNFGFNYSNT